MTPQFDTKTTDGFEKKLLGRTFASRAKPGRLGAAPRAPLALGAGRTPGRRGGGARAGYFWNRQSI